MGTEAELLSVTALFYHHHYKIDVTNKKASAGLKERKKTTKLSAYVLTQDDSFFRPHLLIVTLSRSYEVIPVLRPFPISELSFPAGIKREMMSNNPFVLHITQIIRKNNRFFKGSLD